MTCGQTIRSPKTGLKRTCPGELNGRNKCSFANLHMMGMISGFCITGHHEGVKSTVDGKSQRCCNLWQTCPCDCHDKMSIVLAPKKQQRVAVPNGWRWTSPSVLVEKACQSWSNSDRSQPCTRDWIVKEVFKEKPIDPDNVEKILSKWHLEGRAFVASNPLRFLKFLR